MKGRARAEGAPLIINILVQQGSVPELRSLSLAAMNNSGVKVLQYLHPSCTPKKHYFVTSSQTLPVITITLCMTTNHGYNCCNSL